MELLVQVLCVFIYLHWVDDDSLLILECVCPNTHTGMCIKIGKLCTLFYSAVKLANVDTLKIGTPL